jgi:hypothetical protein
MTCCKVTGTSSGDGQYFPSANIGIGDFNDVGLVAFSVLQVLETSSA